MPRVNTWVPDDLAAVVRERMPDVNYSQVLAEGLRARLACRHDEVACTTCGQTERRWDIEDQAVGRFYADLMWELRRLVERGGTAEGAARIVKGVADRYRVSVASKLPLPRPSRAEREAAKVREFVPTYRTRAG